MILIIPDIHHKVETLNYILQKYTYIPNKISLGDWYDSHLDNTSGAAEEAARAQADFISNPNNICLFGNHDMQYAFPKCRGVFCSGWGEKKQEPIDKWMKPHWNKVKLYEWLTINEKEWLISHAGFHPSFAHPIYGISKDYVATLCEQALNSVRYENHITPILSVGSRRGGSHKFGGCTWLDWRDFKPTEGISQIVGHTIYKNVQSYNENYCIDTQLRDIAILDDDGSIVIESIDCQFFL